MGLLVSLLLRDIEVHKHLERKRTVGSRPAIVRQGGVHRLLQSGSQEKGREGSSKEMRLQGDKAPPKRDIHKHSDTHVSTYVPLPHMHIYNTVTDFWKKI